MHAIMQRRNARSHRLHARHLTSACTVQKQHDPAAATAVPGTRLGRRHDDQNPIDISGDDSDFGSVSHSIPDPPSEATSHHITPYSTVEVAPGHADQ